MLTLTLWLHHRELAGMRLGLTTIIKFYSTRIANCQIQIQTLSPRVRLLIRLLNRPDTLPAGYCYLNRLPT